MARVAPGAIDGDYWNHNTHYHDIVLANVPRGCDQALDVGCGDGLLVRRLAPRARHVTGLDMSAEMIEKARRLSAGLDNVEFVESDLQKYGLPAGHYDFVCSVTAIHHMDFTTGLTAMRDTVRPGGSLVVISLANNAGFRDLLYGVTGLPAHYFHRMLNGKRARHPGPGTPVADPDMTWTEVRDEALRVLPDATFRRLRLWRYAIVWRKPR